MLFHEGGEQNHTQNIDKNGYTLPHLSHIFRI